MLERRYLYFALMALRMRELRAQKTDPAMSLTELRMKSVDNLVDKDNIDNQTNVYLRGMLQRAIAPQVKQILNRFAQIDNELFQHKQSRNQLDEPLVNVDKAYLHEILKEEFHYTAQERVRILREQKNEQQKSGRQNEQQKSGRQYEEALQRLESRHAFLRTKEKAVVTLLDFHGLSTGSGGVPETRKDDFDGIKHNENVDESSFVDVFGMDAANLKNDDKRFELIRQYQSLNICRSALIRQSLGFSVLCLKSTLPNAGRGVFVDGNARVGDLVSFQPGEVWAKEHLMDDTPGIQKHFATGEKDCQTSLRFDDYVVDSRNSPVTVLSQEGSFNPWALGHMVNHPNPGTWPNCQSLMLDYNENDLNTAGLASYIPNTYAQSKTWRSQIVEAGEPILMHGLCLLARRDLSNEELLYDYRLQTDTPPQWYHPILYGDEAMDRQQVVFFNRGWDKNPDDEDEDEGVKKPRGAFVQEK